MNNTCRLFMVTLLALLLSGLSMGQLKPVDVSMTETDKNTAYRKIVNGTTKSYPGFLTVHRAGEKLYFEIPLVILGRELLLGDRVSKISNNQHVAAGQMYKNPLLIHFEKDGNRIFLYKEENSVMDLTTDDEELKVSVERNFVTPVYAVYDIEAYCPDSSAVLIEVTKLFDRDIPDLTPFSGKSKPGGAFDSKASGIVQIKAFSKNIELKSRFIYTGENGFYVEMNRSLLLLEKEPMKSRRSDRRVGYLGSGRFTIGQNYEGVESKGHINRWRMEPKAEDIEKYKRGELVEPAKPIVYYIDNALPEKYRAAVKAGIEAWQVAFEAIGFKNAIVAKDVPVDDPGFDMDDITNSCFRYIASQTANAMGPSWVDPRSGEIIQGDVLWYHNILDRLYRWRFVQTAAVDDKMRGLEPDDEIMMDAVRYAASHEIGHNLGLTHNMRGSFVLPVDSLRSASFTQKYGTTASIMDYARYNYVAQPGDTGVKLTPPVIGVYDMFAIKYGYQPIWEKEEENVLNTWLAEAGRDPMLQFGEQGLFNTVLDPRDQAEDLGDDPVKASDYGIRNLKIINAALPEWFREKGESYSRIANLNKEVRSEYRELMKHVINLIGGRYKEFIAQGEDGYSEQGVAADKQREALDFIFARIRDDYNWIDLPVLMDKDGAGREETFKFHTEVLGLLLDGKLLEKLADRDELKVRAGESYPLSAYLQDLHTKIWQNRAKNKFDENLENQYVNKLVQLAYEAPDAIAKPEVKSSKLFLKPYVLYELGQTEKVLRKRAGQAKGKEKYRYANLLAKVNSLK